MRKNRNIIPEAPHHLILRGNNRRLLFSWEWEYRQFLLFLAEARDQYACLIHALVLMANHIHMLMTPPSKEATSSFVQSFAQRYAQERNKRRGGSGRLFEREFKAFPVTTEARMAEVTAYIDYNAVHHGVRRHPSEYPWSTYGHHVGRPELSKIPASLWTPSDWYAGVGQKAYSQFVDDELTRVEILVPPADFRLRRPNQSRAG